MSTQKILIQLPTTQHAALKSMADRVGISVAAQARIAFQYYIEQHTPKDTMPKTSTSGNSITDLEQRLATLINEKVVFESDTEAHNWMISFLQLRTSLAQRLNRPKESFVMPAWAAEQVQQDPDTKSFSLRKQQVTSVAKEETLEEIEADLMNLVKG